MRKISIDEVIGRKVVLYRCLRGSHVYGLESAYSDVDIGGVYMDHLDDRLYRGRSTDMASFLSEDKMEDITYYELDRFMELLERGDPNTTEWLFCPEKYQEKIHLSFRDVLDVRKQFLTIQLLTRMHESSMGMMMKLKKRRDPDTWSKRVCHAIRLIYNVKTVLDTGDLVLKPGPEFTQFLYKLKTGLMDMSFEEVVKYHEEFSHGVEEKIYDSNLEIEVDRGMLRDLTVKIRKENA